MENTDKQYDRTIGKIREMQPVLEHPEKLSRQIMEHIATRLPEHAAAGMPVRHHPYAVRSGGSHGDRFIRL